MNGNDFFIFLMFLAIHLAAFLYQQYFLQKKQFNHFWVLQGNRHSRLKDNDIGMGLDISRGLYHFFFIFIVEFQSQPMPGSVISLSKFA